MRKSLSCSRKQHSNKGSNWTYEEDQKLIYYIKIHGEGNWRTLPKAAAGLQRCGKSCRVRWINYLKPDMKSGNFGEDEEDLIIKLHALLGNRWSLIAGRLPGRTDNEVKNYWDSNLKKKLINMGIDPNNHRVNETLIRRPISGSSSSDSTSFQREEEETSSPDLNLNLAIPLPSYPSPNFTADYVENKKEVMSNELNVGAQNHALRNQ